MLRLHPISSDEEIFVRDKSRIKDRDVVIHGLTKGNRKIKLSWDPKMNFNIAVATEGKDLTKEVKNWSRRIPNLNS